MIKAHWKNLGLALAVAALGCSNNAKPGGSNGPIFDYDGGLGATISGYTWDPEAFWWGVATCVPEGQQCPYPPITIPKSPLFPRTVFAGALVGLFDPTQPMQTEPLPYMADKPTGNDGGWQIAHVPNRPGPPFIAVAIPMSGALVQPAGGPPLRAIPAATKYFPTMTLKPIITGATTLCLDQATGVFGDVGILDAVARYLRSTGANVTAADFINPAKYGGVAVFWLFQNAGGSPVVRVPAFGATTKVDIGTTYSISWLPPGAGPAAVTAIQSPRGFFVNTQGASGPGADIAVTVTLLPPAKGPPWDVGFMPTDPVVDTSAGRPYTFPSLPPKLTIAPGIVSWGELQANTPGNPPPPEFVCID